MSEVAERIGTSLQNFSQILQNNDIRTGMLERIAEAVGKPVSFFYGEAPAGSQATASGKSSTAVAGNGNQVNAGAEKFLAEISAQRRVTEQTLEHNGRLLGIIEKLSGK